MPDRANIKILIIEDDEDDFYLTEQMIRKIPSGNFDVQWCRSHKEGLSLIREARHDIYFIDYFLPGMTGMELLTNSITINADTPRVLLTGQGNRDIAMQALNAGAADYLVKSELTAEKLER
ncbi:MAG: response regulator, partial [Sphingobacteriales bacterium]